LSVNQRLRIALLAFVAVALGWLAWTGFSGGVNQLRQAQTAGQMAQTLTQFAFGLFALLSIVTTFWGRRWNRAMLIGWTASVTVAAGLASMVWGGTSLLIGLVAGTAALLVGGGLSWLLRVAARGLTRA
jgi:cation transport ATPase